MTSQGFVNFAEILKGHLTVTADSPQKLLVLDPGMAQSFGHHYAYNHVLQSWCTAQKRESRFLFSQHLPAELLSEFSGGRAVLSWKLYSPPQLTGVSPTAAVRHAAEALAADLHAHAGAESDPETLVFAHTLDPTALYGIALWHAALPAAKRPSLALNLMIGMTDSPQCRATLESSCALLRQTGQARLFGGSKGSARLLSAIFGKECPMLPTPLPEPFACFQTDVCPEQPVFGIIGDARQGKNLHILPPAILRYLATGGQGRFHIQLTPTDEALTPVMLALHDISQDYPQQVRLDLSHLDQTDYYRCLAGFTALIIPYSAEDYHVYRPSGPVIESAALGVPILACAGGFAEEELAPLDNGSLFMANASPKELALAFSRFEREKDSRKAKAATARPGYAASHGADAVMRLIGMDGARSG